jgi:hypothetical protein
MKRWMSLIAILAFVSVLIATAPAAFANPAPCGGVYNVGYTIQDRGMIRGSGSMACPGGPGSVTLYVQLERRLGFLWWPIDSNSRSAGGLSYPPVNWGLGVAAPCSSSQHRTRVTATWTNVLGTPFVWGPLFSNTLNGCR